MRKAGWQSIDCSGFVPCELSWNGTVSKNSLPCRVPGLHWPQAMFCIRSGRQKWRSSHVLTSWRNLQSRWWILSPDLPAWLASERQHPDPDSSCQISPVRFPKSRARCECSSVTKGTRFSCRSPRNEGETDGGPRVSLLCLSVLCLFTSQLSIWLTTATSGSTLDAGPKIHTGSSRTSSRCKNRSLFYIPPVFLHL